MYQKAVTLASLFLVLIVSFCPTPLAAQVASDHEIYAGYCMGALTGSKENLPIPPSDLVDNKVVESYKKIHRDIDQKIERFAAYLTARGFNNAGRNDAATAGVLSAKQRGKADQSACGGVTNRCVLSCNSRDRSMTCETRCVNQDQRCRSVQRCEGPDGLPF